jgi:hypothetical protein
LFVVPVSPFLLLTLPLLLSLFFLYCSLQSPQDNVQWHNIHPSIHPCHGEPFSPIITYEKKKHQKAMRPIEAGIEKLFISAPFLDHDPRPCQIPASPPSGEIADRKHLERVVVEKSAHARMHPILSVSFVPQQNRQKK